MPKTIVIADDHPFTAEGMQTEINSVQEFEVVGVAPNGIEAIAMIKRLKPDGALLDLSMPGANGLEVFIEAKRWSPATRFAIITGISAASLFARLSDAGIDGLFIKNSPPEEIILGIAKIVSGERVISPEAQKIIDETKQGQQFSKRELEVLQSLARGQSNKQIADTLGISPKTIDSHRTNLLRKMNVNTTAALLVRAMRDGLIEV
tara:strand:- start:12665 stop:13282 length:618 start_codon:yes stop_codon:yes gene_type:complete